MQTPPLDQRQQFTADLNTEAARSTQQGRRWLALAGYDSLKTLVDFVKYMVRFFLGRS